jgi:hypothetical protein
MSSINIRFESLVNGNRAKFGAHISESGKTSFGQEGSFRSYYEMNFFSDYKTFIAAIRRMVKNENTYIAEVIVCNKNVSVDKSQVEALLLEFIEKENKVN